MAIVYRTVFEDTRADLVHDTTAGWREWLWEKANGEIALPGPGEEEMIGAWTLRHTEAASEGVEAKRFVLIEDQGTSQWTTTLTVLVGSDRQIIWLDLDTVRDEVFGRPPDVRSPIIVRRLIANRTSQMGSAVLHDQAIKARVASDGLLLSQTLYDRDRGAPLVVFSRKYGEDDQTLVRRAERTADRLAGIANTWVFVDEAAEATFNASIHDDLRVYGGAVRTYLPGVSSERPDRWRHKVLRWDVASGHADVAGRIIGRALLERAAAKRPPDLFTSNAHDLAAIRGVAASDEREWLQALEDELSSHEETRRLLTAVIEERDILQSEVAETTREVSSLQGRVRRLEYALREQGQDPWAIVEQQPDVPDVVDSCTAALDMARKHLDGLELPERLDEATAALDQYQESSTFADKAWQALRALQGYVEAKRMGAGGDFGMLLDQGVIAPAIPRGWWTSKESQTTANNPKFRRARMFPVPTSVSESGEVYMEAHVKLVPGGMPAPRIHVYDDTSGPTGKIHVGHFGDHLENSKTN